MNEAHEKRGRSAGGRVGVAAAVAFCLLLAACAQAAPPSDTHYILTVQSDGNSTITTPLGPVSVEPGVATTISGNANSGHTWGGWTVVSGTAFIANPGGNTTTVTLSTGNATVQLNASP